ncbi:facilitated trehalose transporter Tret1-like [Macrobrachium rosenbergii]|uniref:facilitated trehalose transporter Tret1-like n=1 Tax=Macrobrachium rosenbergii TaxID=79674 RepID=UPI0034D4A324
MDWLGRRTLLMVTAPILSAGWLTITFAPNAKIILLGRFICGAAVAFIYSTGPVYWSEVTEARLRGTLVLLSSIFVSIGTVVSYLAGAFFSWRISCYICLAPTILMLAVLWAVPESPYWYLLKGREEDCKASIRWLRGTDYDSAADIAEMKVKLNSVGKKVEYRELWRPRTRKPLLITLFLDTLQQICGGTILIAFAGTIFISAGVEDHRMATIITGLVQVVFTTVCALTADRLGRRPLIICSAFITSIATVFLGLCYFVNDVLEINWPPWAPIVSMLVAVAGYCLGCYNLPWLLSAELFNTTMRSTMSAVNILFVRLLSFAVLQQYSYHVSTISIYKRAFSAWGKARSHTEPCRESREPDEAQVCCVWPGHSASNLKNGRVRYRDGAANCLLPTAPAIHASQCHEGNAEPLGSTPWRWLCRVVCIHDEPRH